MALMLTQLIFTRHHQLAMNEENDSTEVNCDAKDMVGKPPQHYTVDSGNVEIVKCLKKINANFNSIRDEKGFSAFEEALLYKKLDIFKTFTP